jgi:hypothetical protein
VNALAESALLLLLNHPSELVANIILSLISFITERTL